MKYDTIENVFLRSESTPDLCELYKKSKDPFVRMLLECRLFEYDRIQRNIYTNSYNKETIDYYYDLKKMIYEATKE